MSKILITGDLHLHPHRSDRSELLRAEDGLSCLKWIYKTAQTNNIQYVVVAGDFFHNRFALNTFTYSRAIDIVSQGKENGIETIFLLGNHDMYSESDWDVHSLKAIKEWATVIDKPTAFVFGGVSVDFLPYTPQPSKYLGNFNGENKVLISHLAVADALLNVKYDIKSIEDDSQDKETINVNAFNKWKKVWLGHYHFGQKVNDIVEYIGSPYQLSFGEAGQVKHVAIFDLNSLETEYIINDISPQFHIVDDCTKLPESVENDYVQVRSQVPLESKFDLKKSLVKLGARDVEFTPVSNAKLSDEKTAQALSDIGQLFNNKTQLIEEFVNKMNPDMDLALLKKIGLQLISEG